MESYNKQLRDKRELEKKLSMYAKEQKSTINLLNMERSQIQGGLLVSCELVLPFTLESLFCKE